MATVLPSITQTYDSYFLSTWNEIAADGGADQILLAIPITNVLKTNGCFKTQRGGYQVDRNVHYDTGTAVSFVKGSSMPSQEKESTTMAAWKFKNIVAGMQRSMIDDVANAGKDKIRDYVQQRIEDSKDGIQQKYELDFFNTIDTTEAKIDIYSLNDLVPSFNNRATGTYGGIARSNTWWQPKYKAASANPEINLLADWKNLYNTVGNNQDYPDLLVTDQTTAEIYEEFALDASQIIKNASSQKYDLGFDVPYFKGNVVVWTPNMQAGDTLMLNTRWIEVVYDPAMWWYMTEWKSAPLQLERSAQILCRMTGPFTRQPRRHGRLYTSASGSAGASGSD